MIITKLLFFIKFHNNFVQLDFPSPPSNSVKNMWVYEIERYWPKKGSKVGKPTHIPKLKTFEWISPVFQQLYEWLNIFLVVIFIKFWLNLLEIQTEVINTTYLNLNYLIISVICNSSNTWLRCNYFLQWNISFSFVI